MPPTPPAPSTGGPAPSAIDVEEAFDGPSATPAEPARFDEEPAVGAPPPASAGPGPAAPPTIGGGAPPATIFDRFKAKALELDRSKFASLDGTTLVAIEGNVIRIGADAAFHVERLRARQPDLEALATQLFGKPTKITVEIATATAAREQSRESREHERRQRQEALNSEPVNLAIEVLKAEIVEIRPLGHHPGRGGRGD